MLVAAQGFAGDPVQARQPVDPAADQYGVHGRGGHAEPAGNLDRAESVAPSQPDDTAYQVCWGLGRARVLP